MDRVSTTGEIQLRRLPKDASKDNKGYVSLDVYVSDPELQIYGTWDESTGSLTVSTPKAAVLNTPGPHCISLEITAWLPEGTEFTHLLLQAVTLSLRAFDDLDIKVTGESKFTTVSGNINVLEPEVMSIPDPSVAGQELGFNSRRTVVETVSGDIDGKYGLLDYLGCFSVSGKIGVIVSPHAALSSAPSPAILEMHTKSGDIRTCVPGFARKESIIPRNYITRVNTTSGDIMGQFFIGFEASLKTTSGQIGIEVLPVLDSTPGSSLASFFETASLSGDSEIKLLDPFFVSKGVNYQTQREPIYPDGPRDPYPVHAPGDESELAKKAWGNLRSFHKSASGKLSISYPEAWQGNLSVQTISGHIVVTGKDIEIIRSSHGWGKHSLLARNGVYRDDEGSKVQMHAISGDVKFCINPRA